MRIRIKAYRGEKSYASDPGDFGRGQYWSTSKAVAKCYGVMRSKILYLNRPILMTVKEAYDLAGEFGTITGDPDQPHIGSGPFDKRQTASGAMSDFMLSIGYDSMIVEHPGLNRPYFEIVIFK
jgi:hypothetical protein